eukprot:8041644-Ditylum_brightwellii.AAC.1
MAAHLAGILAQFGTDAEEVAIVGLGSLPVFWLRKTGGERGNCPNVQLIRAVGFDLDFIATFAINATGVVKSGQGPVNNIHCIGPRLHRGGGRLVGLKPV